MPKSLLMLLLHCGLLLRLTALPAQAQEQAQEQAPAALSPDETTALRELSAQAGIVFAGQVLSVEHTASRADRSDEGASLVLIRFRVETAVRGCTAGSVYTLREWGGLWVGQAPRYRPGQRLLMLLTAPGRSGLSAPAGGQDGAIPLEPVVAAGGATPTLAPDLRWIGARSRSGRAPQKTARPALTTVLAALGGATDAAR